MNGLHCGRSRRKFVVHPPYAVGPHPFPAVSDSLIYSDHGKPKLFRLLFY